MVTVAQGSKMTIWVALNDNSYLAAIPRWSLGQEFWIFFITFDTWYSKNSLNLLLFIYQKYELLIGFIESSAWNSTTERLFYANIRTPWAWTTVTPWVQPIQERHTEEITKDKSCFLVNSNINRWTHWNDRSCHTSLDFCKVLKHHPR